MNILDYNKIVIFGYPRSGTKLIAKILESFGYYSYGEWYDVWTSKITEENNIDRYDPDHQKDIINTSINSPNFTSNKRVNALIARSNLLCMKEKYVITIWEENLSEFAFILNNHNDCLWVCPQRSHFDQLLSRLLVLYNSNPDGHVISNKIVIRSNDFCRAYWKLHRIESMQKWLVRQNKGVLVPFALLIERAFPGFYRPYEINTLDQHVNLFEFILNLEEVKGWYKDLEIERNSLKSEINL